MKKQLLLIAAFVVCVAAAYAQSSLAIPYQAVARDTTGTPIPNQHMNAQMSIYDSVSTGTPVYVETDTFTTSNLGMFTINIGQGATSIGTFSAINWSKNPKFLQVGLDPTGGTSFINMGTAQLLNVPFALYAAQSNPPTGTGTQVPYYNRSGSFHSDPLFTRNDSTYATQIFRAGSGSVNEGFSLGPALGGNIPDGAFLIRIDTAENHYDYIGEGNFSGTGAGFSNGIGITCQRSGNGPSAFVTIADSNPSNTNVMIVSQNTGTTANEGLSYFDPYQVYIGIATAYNPLSAIGFDSTHIYLFAGGNTFIWPESSGTAGQVLSTDGSGNLSWQSSGSGSGWNLTGNSGTNSGTNFIGTIDTAELVFKTNDTGRMNIDYLGNITMGNPLGAGTTLGVLVNSAGGQGIAGFTNGSFMIGDDIGTPWFDCDISNTRHNFALGDFGHHYGGTFIDVDDSLQWITLSSSAVTIGQLLYHFPAFESPSTVLTNDGSGNLSWQAQGLQMYAINDTITSAQILNSYSSPVTLIPAPGPGKQINILSDQGYYVYGTTSYTINNASGLFLGDTLSAIDNGNISNALADFTQTSPFGSGIGNPKSNQQNNSYHNAPLFFYTQLANPTGGDGYFILTLVYTITN